MASSVLAENIRSWALESLGMDASEVPSCESLISLLSRDESLSDSFRFLISRFGGIKKKNTKETRGKEGELMDIHQSKRLLAQLERVKEEGGAISSEIDELVDEVRKLQNELEQDIEDEEIGGVFEVLEGSFLSSLERESEKMGSLLKKGNDLFSMLPFGSEYPSSISREDATCRLRSELINPTKSTIYNIEKGGVDLSIKGKEDAQGDALLQTSRLFPPDLLISSFEELTLSNVRTIRGQSESIHGSNLETPDVEWDFPWDNLEEASEGFREEHSSLFAETEDFLNQVEALKVEIARILSPDAMHRFHSAKEAGSSAASIEAEKALSFLVSRTHSPQNLKEKLREVEREIINARALRDSRASEVNQLLDKNTSLLLELEKTIGESHDVIKEIQSQQVEIGGYQELSTSGELERSFLGATRDLFESTKKTLSEEKRKNLQQREVLRIDPSLAFEQAQNIEAQLQRDWEEEADIESSWLSAVSYSEESYRITKDEEALLDSSSSMKALYSEFFAPKLQSLQALLNAHNNQCTNLHTLLEHLKQRPAQHCCPSLKLGGKTLSEWLQLYDQKTYDSHF